MTVGDKIPEILGKDQNGKEIKTKFHFQLILDYKASKGSRSD